MEGTDVILLLTALTQAGAEKDDQPVRARSFASNEPEEGFTFIGPF